MAAIRHSVTLEELVAFNDELRSLARAGIPLERGLRALRGDLPGKLGQLAENVSTRIERGENLAALLHDPALALPPVYSAVVAAGVRSGRLPAALESLTKSVQRSTDLRRTLIVSLVYPLIVLGIASVIFSFTWAKLFPVMQIAVPSLIDHEMPMWFQYLSWSVERGGLWLFLVWAGVFLVAAIWIVGSNRALRFAGGSFWLPSIGIVNSAGRTATFAEMLALLIEHQVPLVEALPLAGAASGDRRVSTGAEQLAERIRSGNIGGAAPRGLPPLLSWLILTNAPTIQLVKTLRQTAASLRERAMRISISLGIYLPIVLSATVGAIIAAYYAILVMTPFYYLLNQLALP